jgi:hypothetical protein
LANQFNEPKVRGRHLAFDDGSETGILELIQSQAEKSEPVTRTTFNMTAKPCIAVPFLEDGLIL